MASFLSILNKLLYNPKIINLKNLFIQGFNIQIADYGMINNFVIDKLNLYRALNTENCYL